MENEGIQLFINICIVLVVLIIAQVALKQWDRRAKAKEAEAAKLTAKKKK